MNKKKVKTPYLILVFISLIFVTFSFLKILSPGSPLIGLNQTHWSFSDYFDQSVSFVAAKNYSTNGFFSNFGLQDRSGLAIHSRLNIPCHGVPGKSINMKNFEGDDNKVKSLSGDCIYTKAPSLPFFIYGIIYKWFGGERGIRVFGVLGHLLLLLVIFKFLKRIFGIYPALSTVAIYSISSLYWGWAHFLYAHSIALTFTLLCFHFYHSRAKYSLQLVFLFGFFASYSILDIIPFINLYVWSFSLLALNRHHMKMALIVTFSSLLALSILSIQASLYLGGLSYYFAEFGDLTSRYSFFGSNIDHISKIVTPYFHLLRETFYPIELLFTLFITSLLLQKENSKSKFNIHCSFSLLVASFGICFYSPGHSVYHISQIFYFSQLFWLYLICMSLYLVKNNFTKKVYISLYFFIFLICGYFSSAILIKDFNQIIHNNRYDFTNDLSREIIDITLEQYPSNNDIYIFTHQFWEKWDSRTKVVDGMFPPQASGFVFNAHKKARLHFFFNGTKKVKQVSFLIDKKNLNDFKSSCEIWIWSKKLSQKQSKIDKNEEFNNEPNYTWVVSKINKLIKGILIECTSNSNLELFEIRAK